MRLIDADALLEEMVGITDGWLKPPKDWKWYEDSVRNAPTVDLPDALRAAGWKEEGWVSVKDRLPEEKGWYMVYAPGYSGGSSSGLDSHNGVMFAKWSGKTWSIEVGYHKRPGCVRKWMPIPEPPEEDEKHG